MASPEWLSGLQAFWRRVAPSLFLSSPPLLSTPPHNSTSSSSSTSHLRSSCYVPTNATHLRLTTLMNQYSHTQADSLPMKNGECVPCVRVSTG
ncbi:hypothetical protein E2C01_099438 [Portunus trituberculatus]|uniref:Uncharacterized protein n=1 Tax=Portunus trituberculatus TaxID=210409 RepID=A0A5B7KAS7_PORTR|nr:hypothetical protein [Portunus trituberculatus]